MAHSLDFIGCVRQGQATTQYFKTELEKAGWTVMENNQHKQDKTPDLYLTFAGEVLVPFEVKSITTPFRKAKEYVGIPPEECVTLPTMELQTCIDYNQGKGLIAFYIDYRPEFDTFGQYFATVKHLEQLKKQAEGTRRIRRINMVRSQKREKLYFPLGELNPFNDLLHLSKEFNQVSGELLSLIGLAA